MQILSRFHLPYQILRLIENAQDYVVLVTAYLQSWPNLDQVIRSAVARRVRITLIVRSPDGNMQDQSKRAHQIEQMKKLGVEVVEVVRLHAKVAVSESEAIVSSFNLVDGGQDSVNLGVRLTSGDDVSACLREIDVWAPGVLLMASTIKANCERRAPVFCIGCGQGRPIFNRSKPYCAECYRMVQEAGAAACRRPSCHGCGASAPTRICRPLCIHCHARSAGRAPETRGGSLRPLAAV